MTETTIPAAPGTYATLLDAFCGKVHVEIAEIVAWRVTKERAVPVFYVDIGPHTLALRAQAEGRYVDLIGGSTFDDLDDAKGLAIARREFYEEQAALRAREAAEAKNKPSINLLDLARAHVEQSAAARKAAPSPVGEKK